MALGLGFTGYGPEHSDRDVARLDSVMDKMTEHLKVFDLKKVSAEDYKRVENYKNGAGVIVRGVNAKRDCLVASGKTAAMRERLREKPRRKTA